LIIGLIVFLHLFWILDRVTSIDTMVRVLFAVLFANLPSSLAKEVVVPLAWAQPEGRLTFEVSVQVEDTWYTSVSRLDLGSKQPLMLPSDICRTTGCGSGCVNDGCKCAKSDKLLMPAHACPDGSTPTSSSYHHNGRTCVQCEASDMTVELGDSGSMKLRGQQVLYMNKLTKECDASASPKTGFNGAAPFTHAIFDHVDRKTIGLSMQSLQLTFGATPPRSAAAIVPWRQQDGGSGGGRQVRIIAVNGKDVSNVVAAIDSGNGAFLTYGSGSPLEAATRYPFSVTFEGGDTLTFTKAPEVNGRATSAQPYNHNVLSLGFMANFDITFDDSNNKVYFVGSRRDIDASALTDGDNVV